jgi:hypothetical protein
MAVMAMTVAAQPQATWLERHHNFGVFMEKDGKVRCSMRVVNTGNAPLIIVKVQAGCGCTGITYPEKPIPPGDTAVVGISYNPSGRPGQFTKQALIFTNTTPKRSILEITGNVIPTDATLDKQYPLKAGPLRISQGSIPFGELAKGESRTQYLSAFNASTDTILVSVTGAKPHLKPAMVPDTVPPASVTAITVHYLAKHAPLWGLNVDTLTLTCRPLRQHATPLDASATVNVMAQVMEDFKGLTDKERLDAPVVSVDCDDTLGFGFLKAGDKKTVSFTVTNKGKSPLIIRRVWVPDGEGVTVSADRTEVKRDKSATVTVTVDTSLIQGNLLNVPLTLLCNDPDSPRLIIHVVGAIEE